MFVLIIILKVAKSEIGSYTREVAKEKERREWKIYSTNNENLKLLKISRLKR